MRCIFIAQHEDGVAVCYLLYTKTDADPTHQSDVSASSAPAKIEMNWPVPFWDALTHSAGVMMLQKPETHPATSVAVSGNEGEQGDVGTFQTYEATV